MLTTDLALRFDPIYEPISRRFLENPDAVRGRVRPGLVQADPPRHGPDPALPRPAGAAGGADLAGPGARRRPRAGRRRRHRRAQGADPRLRACRSPSWSPPRGRRPRRSAAATSAAARTARRIRLEPQRGWEVNDPDELAQVLRTLEGIQESFNSAQTGGKKVSLADLIVLGGVRRGRAGRQERRPRRRGPVHPGPHRRRRRSRPTSSRSPPLEPTADGFRNYRGKGHRLPAEYLLVDRANLLTLSAPEMTVLVGGLRVLGANHRQSTLGVLTATPGVADQRLLRQPARHGHDVDVDGRGRGDLRGPRPRHRRGQVDRQPRRPGLRLELRAARRRRGLRERRRQGEVRRATSSPRGTRS